MPDSQQVLTDEEIRATAARYGWHPSQSCDVVAMVRAVLAKMAGQVRDAELIRLSKVAVRECCYAKDREPQDWMAAAMTVCRSLAARTPHGGQDG